MNHTPSLQLITDAVMAQYIHEISERHRSAEPEPSQDQDGRPDAAPALDCAGQMFV